jgi:photosystem II stability/assembly factor-like uncharacterized protein
MKPLMRVFFFAVIQILVVTFNLQAQGWQAYWGASVFVSLSAVNDSVCWFGGWPTRVILATVHSLDDYDLSGRTPYQIDPSDGVMAIHARGASLAWVGTSSGSLYKTTNGGTEWVKQFTQKDSAFIDGIYFWNDSIGIAFGDPVTYPGTGPFIILRTTDGGTTWNDISSSSPSVTGQYGLTEVFDAVGSHFWFPSVSDSSYTVAPRYLFHSRDRGLTWEKLSVPANFGNFCVAFSDTSNGLITNWRNNTARTTDGGKTWSVRSNGVGWGRLKGQKGTNNFWVCGYWDAQNRTYPIYYSSDFGLTWAKQPTNLPAYVDGISVSSGNVVWVCSDNYLILRNSTANVATSVATLGGEPSVPPSFELQQNYPNPFNPSTTIKYYVRQEGATKLQVFDAVGRQVRTLVNSNQSKGWHMIFWDGTNDKHQSVATGTYFYRIENNGKSEAKKMLLLR